MKKYLFLLAAILINCSLLAQIPNTISWQGIIQDGSGNNLDGNFNVTVKLYDVETGGTALWTESHSDLDIDNGIANIVLGSVNPFGINFDKQYWLEITVGSGIPLPRIKLSSVPYSLYSAKSNGVIVNDSLVLKDAKGVTRMILNPNTGTFKMMNNDTSWYELKVQSPKQEIYTLSDDLIMVRNVIDGGEELILYKGGNMEYRETSKKDYDGFVEISTVTKEEFTKNSNGVYVLTNKNSEESTYNFVDANMSFQTNTTTNEVFDLNGKLLGKTINYKKFEKINNEEKNIKEYKEIFNYDINGNVVGHYIIKDEFKGGIKSTTTEFFKDGILREKEIITTNLLTGNKTKTTEFYDDNAQKVSEFTEKLDITNSKKTSEIKKGSQGTKVEQSHNKLIYSNTGSSNYVKIEEDSYLGKFDVSAYIGGQEKKLFSCDANGVYYGINNNILTNQTGTTFSGFVNSSGTTQFQGNTFHNGTNYFSGDVYGNKAQFNGNFTAGNGDDFFSAKGDADVSGDFSVGGDTQLGSDVTVGGSLYVQDDLDLTNSDLNTNSVKSNTNLEAKGVKKFVIDHPADNTKLIQHASIESNAVYNQYMGNVTTDGNGLAKITLPAYFPLINNSGECFYQLTPLSLSFVQAIVIYSYDEDTNSFTIKTSAPNTQVSWQLTAKRLDSTIPGNPFNDVISK